MKNIKLLSLTMIILFLVVSFASCKKPAVIPNDLAIKQDQKQEETKKPVTIPKEDIVPNFEIIKKTDQERTDKGLTVYIIIRPVDLSSGAFVGSIKNLVKKLVKEDIKSEKITIEIFDSMNALDLYAKDNKSSAPLLVTRHVAKYVGGSDSEIYKNTLYLFPNSTKDDKSEAGKYFDIIDFDPSNW